MDFFFSFLQCLWLTVMENKLQHLEKNNLRLSHFEITSMFICTIERQMSVALSVGES